MYHQDDLVERTTKFASLRAPDARDLKGLKDWIQHRPLTREESSHLLHATDFVALVEKQEECWLDTVVERALSKCFPRDVPSCSILAGSNSTKCARAYLPRRNNVVSAKIQSLACAASTASIY